ELARLVADSQLAPEHRETCMRRHSRHYLGVLAAAERLYMSGDDHVEEGLRLFEIEWPNIRAGQAWAEQHADDPDATRLCSLYPYEGANVLYLRQPVRERVRWLKAALQAARNSGKRNEEAAHLGNLGLAYTDLKDNEQAIRLYEEQA